MAIYSVLIPMAGHLVVEVTAENEAEAKEKAFEEATIDHLEEWEALSQFNKGNVCYCPSPWEVEAVKVGDDDPE